jgi:hypothetical protein
MDTEMSASIVWAINALKEIGEEVIGTEEYSQALLEAPDEVGCFYEEVLMCEVYTRINDDLGIYLEPSTQSCFGRVDAYPNSDCEWTIGRGTYDFGEEIKLAMGILSELQCETATQEEFVISMVDAIKELLVLSPKECYHGSTEED